VLTGFVGGQRKSVPPRSGVWEGAGVQGTLEEHAERTIPDADFRAERALPNGSRLNTKEELMYYRVFCEHFGADGASELVGRTKGAPVAA